MFQDLTIDLQEKYFWEKANVPWLDVIFGVSGDFWEILSFDVWTLQTASKKWYTYKNNEVKSGETM